MENNNEEKKYISKVRLTDNSEYNLKDTLLRHQINVLLGIEEPDERDE